MADKYAKEMFNCPVCKEPIKNYIGSLANETPNWAADPEALLVDDTSEDTPCAVCGVTGYLIGCDSCYSWYHSAWANCGIDF
jgi:hypothetical protein